MVDSTSGEPFETHEVVKVFDIHTMGVSYRIEILIDLARHGCFTANWYRMVEGVWTEVDDVRYVTGDTIDDTLKQAVLSLREAVRATKGDG